MRYFRESSKAWSILVRKWCLVWRCAVECTGSISKGKTAEKHNTRECYDSHNCPENVDLDRSGENVLLVNRSLEEVYAELFGKACEEYNAKQVAKGHPERAVPDYLEKVKADKQLKPMYEFVVQVGNLENHPDTDTCVRVLSRWLAEFNERFGQHFAIKQAIVHLDEATPHLHLEVVPVATSKRGLAVQNSLSKAIKQAGFDDYKSMMPAWDDLLTAEMERAGIARVAGSEERSRGHMTVEQYKDFQRSQELLRAQRDELAATKAELAETNDELETMAWQLDEHKAALTNLLTRRDEVESQLAKLQPRLERLQGLEREEVARASALERACEFAASLVDALIDELSRAGKALRGMLGLAVAGAGVRGYAAVTDEVELRERSRGREDEWAYGVEREDGSIVLGEYVEDEYDLEMGDEEWQL